MAAVLMLSATVTQMIMNSYENALALMPQLAGFVPMLLEPVETVDHRARHW